MSCNVTKNVLISSSDHHRIAPREGGEIMKNGEWRVRMGLDFRIVLYLHKLLNFDVRQ